MADGRAGVIGRGIRIKGDLSGKEDLTIEGQLEGKITFKTNHLTLETSSVVNAQIEAQEITIKGDMTGNTEATQQIEITADAKMQGDIKAPQLVMHEGAKFRGAVDMEVELPAGLLDPPEAKQDDALAARDPLMPLAAARDGADVYSIDRGNANSEVGGTIPPAKRISQMPGR